MSCRKASLYDSETGINLSAIFTLLFSIDPVLLMGGYYFHLVSVTIRKHNNAKIKVKGVAMIVSKFVLDAKLPSVFKIKRITNIHSSTLMAFGEICCLIIFALTREISISKQLTIIEMLS